VGRNDATLSRVCAVCLIAILLQWDNQTWQQRCTKESTVRCHTQLSFQAKQYCEVLFCCCFECSQPWTVSDFVEEFLLSFEQIQYETNYYYTKLDV